MAKTEAVRIGKAPRTTETIAAAKMPNSRQEGAVSPSGTGQNQIPSPTATASPRISLTFPASLTTRLALLAQALHVSAQALFSARALASASLPRHRGRVEHLLDLLFGQDLLLADQLQDAPPGLHRLGGQL